MSYSIQIASDIYRDGLGIELVDQQHNVVAEIFRCDKDKSLTFSSFQENLPYPWVERMIFLTRTELGAFEDGSPLPAAISQQVLVVPNNS